MGYNAPYICHWTTLAQLEHSTLQFYTISQPIFCFPDPDTLTKESVRNACIALNLSAADNNLAASSQKTSFSHQTSCRSQISSNCFSCNYSEIQFYSGSESETEADEEDGESQLSTCEWQESFKTTATYNRV